MLVLSVTKYRFENYVPFSIVSAGSSQGTIMFSLETMC